MLQCVIIAGLLFIGDDARMFPTQGAYYFHLMPSALSVYQDRNRVTGIPIPKEMRGETVQEVIGKCIMLQDEHFNLGD